MGWRWVAVIIQLCRRGEVVVVEGRAATGRHLMAPSSSPRRTSTLQSMKQDPKEEVEEAVEEVEEAVAVAVGAAVEGAAGPRSPADQGAPRGAQK